MIPQERQTEYSATLSDSVHGQSPPRLRITENKITETEVIGNNTAQVYIHLLGILVNKAGSVLCRIGSILRLGRLDNQGYERIILTYLGT